MAKDVLNKSKLAEGYEKVLNNALSGEEVSSFSVLDRTLDKYMSEENAKVLKLAVFSASLGVVLVLVAVYTHKVSVTGVVNFSDIIIGYLLGAGCNFLILKCFMPKWGIDFWNKVLYEILGL